MTNNRVRYMGIDRDKVVDSLVRAHRMLREADLGPVCNSRLHNWTECNPVIKLKNAKTSEEFAKVMGETRTFGMFFPFGDFFLYKAMTAAADEVDDGAVNLYRTLALWGAFLFKNGQSEEALQGEVFGYLVQEGFQRLIDYGGDVEKGNGVMQMLLNDPRFMAAAQVAEEIMDVMPVLTLNGEQELVRRMAAAMNPAVRFIAQNVMTYMLDLAPQRTALRKSETAVKFYTVGLPNVPADRAPAVAALQEKLHQMFSRFNPLHEFLGYQSLRMRNEGDEVIFGLNATPRVAQMLANDPDILVKLRMGDEATVIKPHSKRPRRPGGPGPGNP